MNSKFRDMMKGNTAKVMAAVKQEFQAHRFDYGTHNEVRLRKALASEGLYDLQERTLLSPEVHAIHADRLAKRYLKKLNSVERSVRKQQQDLLKMHRRHRLKVDPPSLSPQDRFRFVTILHSLEPLDIDATMRIIKGFKQQLGSVVESCRGIWCVGAIEVEVVNMALLRKHKEQTDSEERKFLVCKSMESRLATWDQGSSSYFLIHFHGIVVKNQRSGFEELERGFKQRWNDEPRQVQIKPLSKAFNGMSKTPKDSLIDIARYVTKGGNDWVKKKPYLRYKMSFDNEHLATEEAWVNTHWRRDEELRGERMEDGLEDTLSMTSLEICALARVIDGMMGLDRKRTGYLVVARSRRKNLITTGSRTLKRSFAA